MAHDPGASSISVTVRVRPFTIQEAAQLTKCDPDSLFLGDGSLAAIPTPRLIQKGIRPVIKVIDDKCLVFDPPEDNPVHRFSRTVVGPTGKKVKDQTFAFDKVFDENTTQGEIYESTTRGLLESVLDGYNATVFAYGATGCGKTHTITGTSQQPGIIFLTMQELFEKIAERSDEKSTELSLSYLEIYNEQIRDLLVPGGSKQGLMLREDANQAVSVSGLSSHHPQNVQEVMDMIVRGNEYRTVNATAANATSSRSHAVLQINVAQKDRNADVSEPHTMATLSIIDLAGSERASATKNRGERLTEGANINKSLLALGSCINALCDPRKKNHVPYRNSKLTRLLKFSLGGNCKTVMIVCVSPSSQHFDETQNTLRYANRAKNIQTKVTRNVFNVNRHVKDYLVKIEEQIALINELKAQQKDYEGQAFIKFRKQTDKKDALVREGIERIRAAYDNAQNERQEKTTNMKKLRQIERRIGMLSAWIAAFDGACESREDGEMPPSITAMRKTAQGILLELENSRHHYHQRLGKCNWERLIDAALQNAIRQLNEAEGTTDTSDVSRMTREAELLKSNASRDSLREVLEMEKGSEHAITQALLAALFDTIASLNDLIHLSEEEAVQHAKTVLTRLINSCSIATSQVIKPDGSLPVTEVFPPTKRGTPKRKKAVNLMGAGGRGGVPPLALNTAIPPSPSTPMKGSPRRRKPINAKKGVSFTPKKKTPSKRSVRWRDDADAGSLAEFEKTPQKILSTPDTPSNETTILPPPPPVPSYLRNEVAQSTGSAGSSPIPAAPQPSTDLRQKTSARFQAGFLSKKSDGSAGSPNRPPVMTSLSGSDTDNSPLRLLDAGKAANRTALNVVSVASPNTTTNTPSASTSPERPGSSDGENKSAGNSSWTADIANPDSAAKIRNALKSKRMSATGGHGHDSAARVRQKRRSRSPPMGASSPPQRDENHMFTASQARRMVGGGEKTHGGLGKSVLSPRTGAAAVGKVGRERGERGERGERLSLPMGAAKAASARLAGGLGALGSGSGSGSGGLGSGGTPRARETGLGKGAWR